MQKPNDLNQSRIVLKQDSTLIAVIEMSLWSWLVAGIVPGVERSRVARAPARQDRPSRHRAAQARLSRLAARRARSLQDGGDPDYQGRRCQAAQPRAPEPRWRANSDCQPNESSVDPAGHPRLQSQAEEGRRAPRRFAHARGRTNTAQHAS